MRKTLNKAIRGLRGAKFTSQDTFEITTVSSASRRNGEFTSVIQHAVKRLRYFPRKWKWLDPRPDIETNKTTDF